MKILLTNDDGYNAKGIQILYEKLQKYGDVILVAPEKHMSGKSMARAFGDKLEVIQHEENIYSVNGTPADAVVLALFGLNIRPDLLVSGINHGYNLSADTAYSGTIGAAMEAVKEGIPAIAFSADYNGFKNAEKDVDYVMNYILNRDLISKNYLLNVNFIRSTHKKAKGIMITDLGKRPLFNFYEKEGNHYLAKRRIMEYTPDEGTDLYAIRNSYISITPLKFGNSTEQGLKELRNKVSRSEKK